MAAGHQTNMGPGCTGRVPELPLGGKRTDISHRAQGVQPSSHHFPNKNAPVLPLVKSRTPKAGLERCLLPKALLSPNQPFPTST